jgi:hypothetical protein
MGGMGTDRAQRLRRSDPRELGGYRLLGRLGSGGMGVVYLAQAPDDTAVAVKMVHAALAGDEEFRHRFRGEVRRARQVPAFCTAEVLDADPDHDPPYLVVEYVDAPSLGEAVERDGPLTPANVHGVAIGVASALTAIHGAGVVHRDLKPRNVLLAPGSPKVIDFGIARAFEGTGRYTRTGQMVGTLAYLAPERFDDSFAPVGAAADIFAWGAVVTYAATGRTPFEGGSATALATRILSDRPNLAGLPPDLGVLAGYALAKDPADRPTARELLDLLLGAAHSRPAPAERPARTGVPVAGVATIGPPAVPRHRPRSPDGRSGVVPPDVGAAHGGRRQVLVQALALLLLVAGLVVGGLAVRHDRAADAPPATRLAPADAARALPPARPAPGAVVSELNGLCLDIPDADPADRQPVRTWPCSGDADQVWTWAADGTLRGLDRCLDAADDATADGTAVRLLACDGSTGQVWRYTAGRDIVNPAADKCLDIVDREAAEGARLQLWTCGGTANQKWTLRPS